MGCGYTLMFLVRLSLQPLLFVIINLTGKVPELIYVCAVGEFEVEIFPLPKFQL